MFISAIIVLIALFVMGKRVEEIYEYTPNEEIMITHFDSGWLPYWDYQGAKLDWVTSQERASEIVAFGVLYQGEDLYVPEETDLMTKELVEMVSKEESVYLSFINDTKQEDGSFVQKDKGLLETILPYPEKRSTQIENIINLSLKYGVDGIEIDFENIKNDVSLWESFAEFTKELNEACEQHQLGLRIVLSYDSVKYTEFPIGPTYVIMCYNLYGLHSQAGPKANQDFLDEVFELNEVLKPNVVLAYANHGFSWADNGDITAITKDQAFEMADIYEADIYREDESGALYYTYKDSSDMSYDVWFADETTLDQWVTWANNAGYDKSAIWRYGK